MNDEADFLAVMVVVAAGIWAMYAGFGDDVLRFVSEANHAVTTWIEAHR